jgi:hypothetical protein
MCAELDRICAEAFARLDALDFELYHRGFLSKSPREVRKSIPMTAAPRPRDVPGGALVPRDTPPPVMPPQAPAIDTIAAIKAMVRP